MTEASDNKEIEVKINLGTSLEFNPPIGQDIMQREGVTCGISTRHQCITAMKSYQRKSIEELRLEDYLINRKSHSQITGGLVFGRKIIGTLQLQPGIEIENGKVELKQERQGGDFFYQSPFLPKTISGQNTSTLSAASTDDNIAVPGFRGSTSQFSLDSQIKPSSQPVLFESPSINFPSRGFGTTSNAGEGFLGFGTTATASSNLFSIPKTQLWASKSSVSSYGSTSPDGNDEQNGDLQSGELQLQNQNKDKEKQDGDSQDDEMEQGSQRPEFLSLQLQNEHYIQAMKEDADKIGQLEKQIKVQSVRYSALQDEVSDIGMSKNRLKAENTILKEELEDMRKSLMLKEEKLQRRTDKDRQLRNNSDENELLQQENEDNQFQFTTENDDVSGVGKLESRLKAENMVLKAELRELRKLLILKEETLQNRADNDRQLREKSDQNEILQQENDALQYLVKNKNDIIENLISQLEESKRNFEGLSKTNHRYLEQIANLSLQTDHSLDNSERPVGKMTSTKCEDNT